MKKQTLTLLLMVGWGALPAQTVQDNDNRTRGYVKSDDTVQDSNNRTDGQVSFLQNASLM